MVRQHARSPFDASLIEEIAQALKARPRHPGPLDCTPKPRPRHPGPAAAAAGGACVTPHQPPPTHSRVCHMVT